MHARWQQQQHKFTPWVSNHHRQQSPLWAWPPNSTRVRHGAYDGQRPLPHAQLGVCVCVCGFAYLFTAGKDARTQTRAQPNVRFSLGTHIQCLDNAQCGWTIIISLGPISWMTWRELCVCTLVVHTPTPRDISTPPDRNIVNTHNTKMSAIHNAIHRAQR